MITILANDDASGVVNFLSPDNVTVNEPADGSTEPGTVQIALVRGPGIFGVVTVEFEILGPDNEPVTDLSPDRGIITFQNKHVLFFYQNNMQETLLTQKESIM